MSDQENMCYVSEDESSCESYYDDSESSSQWSTTDDLNKDANYSFSQDSAFYSDED